MVAWQRGGVVVAAVALMLNACGGSSRVERDGPGDAGAGGSGAGRGGSGSGGTAARGGTSAGGTSAGGMSAGSGGVSRGGSGSAGKAGAGGAANAGRDGDAGEGGSADAGRAGSTAAGSGGNGGRGGGDAGSSNAGTGGANVELPEALVPVVTASCAAAATCCGGAGEALTLDECKSMYAGNQPAVVSVVSGAITLDEAALARCEAAYADGPDQCNLNAVVAACRGVYIGHRAVDESCVGMYDCDRSDGAMACVMLQSGDMGVCKRIPHAEAGEPCSFSCELGEDCSNTTIGSAEALPLCFEEDGLYCDWTAEDPVCRPIVALGDACEGYDACGSRAHCDTVCTAKSTLGELCGAGCLRQFQCGDDGRCRDPSWAGESACMGYAPGP